MNLSQPEKTSYILRKVLTELPKGQVSVKIIVKPLHRRSFGGLFILLSFFALLPGISVLTGLIIVMVGVQLFVGLRLPYLPLFIREYSFDSGQVYSVGMRGVVQLEKLERFIRPRAAFLSKPPFTVFMGLVIVCLGAVITIPLPFSNFPPALALLFLSIGLLTRDGVVVIIGFLIAAIALSIGWFVAYFAIENLAIFINKHF